MNSNVSSVAKILNQNYIKYDIMYHLTRHAFYKNSDAENVDIYIDMNSLTGVLYSIKTNHTQADSYAVSASMINLAAHMRSYFITRHGVVSRIFIVYAKNYPENSVMVKPEYNAHKIMDRTVNIDISNLILQNVELLKTVCPYLPKIYFIDGGDNETSVVMGAIITKNNKDDNYTHTNIIVTKDTYAYQAVSYLPLTFIYRPRKSSGVDTSWVVTKSNLLNVYRMDLGVITENPAEELSSALYLPIVAAAGLRSREIRSLCNINTAMKNLYKAVLDRNIDNDINGCNYIRNAVYLSGMNSSGKLGSIYNFNENKEEEFKDNLKALDFVYALEGLVMNPMFSSMLVGIIDLSSPSDVRKINDNYYQYTPLDLERI